MLPIGGFWVGTLRVAKTGLGRAVSDFCLSLCWVLVDKGSAVFLLSLVLWQFNPPFFFLHQMAERKPSKADFGIWEDWQVGKHGIIIEFVDPQLNCVRTATFLPDVPPEQDSEPVISFAFPSIARACPDHFAPGAQSIT
eukprot:1162143-Pelagomonas_calceolata.AAC.22